MATGSNGFHVFKPAINDASESLSDEEDDAKHAIQVDEKELDAYMAKMSLNWFVHKFQSFIWIRRQIW